MPHRCPFDKHNFQVLRYIYREDPKTEKAQEFYTIQSLIGVMHKFAYDKERGRCHKENSDTIKEYHCFFCRPRTAQAVFRYQPTKEI
nr:MAG TPA: hypothetical protein [Caudoviricetes sp.]